MQERTHHIWLTERSGSEQTAETPAGKNYVFHSRSGLHPTELALLKALPRCASAPKAVLAFGGRTGAVALLAKILFPQARVACHTFDAHHAQTIQRNLGATHTESSIELYNTPDFPDGSFDLVIGSATQQGTPSELLLDNMENAARIMPMAGRYLLSTDHPISPILKQAAELFGASTTEAGVLHAQKQQEPKRARSFQAEFTASLPGHAPLKLISRPGVFCHRRPDMGGIALAEVAVRDLASGDRILDLGCGCGMVGLLLATAAERTACTFIDSHARAVACTQANLERLALNGHTVLLNDTGDCKGPFDCFVGNPPYYGNYRIAELFIQTAQRTVRSGGRIYFVAKTADRLLELMSEAFGNAEPITRRGYTVIKSIHP